MTPSTGSDLALFYRRAGFGLRSDELDRMTAGGYEAAVEQLIGGLGDAPDPAGDALPAPQFAARPLGTRKTAGAAGAETCRTSCSAGPAPAGSRTWSAPSPRTEP